MDAVLEDNEMLIDIKGCMLCDASMLSVKVAGEEAGKESSEEVTGFQILVHQKKEFPFVSNK